MGNEASDQAFADVGDVIAANLRRLRTARRMSLATLASRADVAKATLANLEQGRGNPTIETLWSLALGLGVAFSDLLEDRRETTTVVVRAQQGARVRGSTPGGQLDLRLLDRIERGGLVEVFDLFLPARTDHLVIDARDLAYATVCADPDQAIAHIAKTQRGRARAVGQPHG